MELKEFIDLVITRDLVSFIYNDFGTRGYYGGEMVVNDTKEYLLEKLTKKDES